MLINKLSEELTKRGYSCEIQEVAKTNGKKTGLVISQGEGDLVAPTIYDDMIAGMTEPGLGMDELADRVVEFIESHPAPAINAEDLNSMIRQVNEEVRQEDRLSDHAYSFDGKKLGIVQTQTYEMKRAGRSR